MTLAGPVEEVERALRDACGITLTEGLRATLGESVRRAARAAGLEPDAFQARLRARDPRCLAELVEAAVVGETYFFRHPEQLDALRETVLDRAPRERPLRLWSAGCATGEEPYSLAMLLRDAGRGDAGDRVLATDVSARALAVAAAASYGAWSLRRLDPAARARHFEGAPPTLRVRAEVRAAVELRRHNLFSDPPPPGPFDVVVCRNVLIYFEADTARAIAARLLDALAPGGTLVVGPVEVPLAERLGAERVEVGTTTLFRKVDEGRRERMREVRREVRPSTSLAPFDAAQGRLRQAQGERTRSGPAPTPTPTAALTPSEAFEQARDAARRGEVAFAEGLAREVAEGHLCPESYLLVAMAAESRGDVRAAVDALRRALYLDPGLAMAHAALVPLYARLGRDDDAARARRNALEAVAGLDDGAPLRGVEPITAGALRSALGEARRPPAATGRSET